MRARYLFGVSLALCLWTADRPAASPDGTCFTTASSNPPSFALPAPYDSLPNQPQQFWYGSQALWTRLSADGHWHGAYDAIGKTYRNKLFVWRPGYDPRTEPIPELLVTARRLDGDAPEMSAPRVTNAFAKDIGSAMLAMPAIPRSGCWELTLRYAAESVTFVVAVQ